MFYSNEWETEAEISLQLFCNIRVYLVQTAKSRRLGERV